MVITNVGLVLHISILGLIVKQSGNAWRRCEITLSHIGYITSSQILQGKGNTLIGGHLLAKFIKTDNSRNSCIFTKRVVPKLYIIISHLSQHVSLMAAVPSIYFRSTMKYFV